MLAGFINPDFSARIDPTEFVRGTPPEATIRGSFLASLLTMAGTSRRELSDPCKDKKYHAFKNYPLVEQVRLLPEVASVLHPNVSLGEGLRRIGRRVYPMFAASLAGRVIFSTVGHNPKTVLSAGVKAYNVSSSVGQVDVISLDEHHGHFRLDGIYNYIGQYHVGIFEGAVKGLGFEPSVLIKQESRISGEFYVTW
jgi:uncharacterized protein (TIGR02265 family)